MLTNDQTLKKKWYELLPRNFEEIKQIEINSQIDWLSKKAIKDISNPWTTLLTINIPKS